MKKNFKTIFTAAFAATLLFSACQKELEIGQENINGVEKSSSQTSATNTLWVAASGGSNSNPGTELRPYATIQKAVDNAVPGTTIILKNGLYRITSPIVFKSSGQDGNRIYLRAQNRLQAVITGANTSGTPVVPANVSANERARSGLINILGRSWITIDGIRVQKSQRFGIFVGDNTAPSTPVKSNKIDIINCLTEDTYASGIIAVQSSNINIKWNTVQRACLDPNTSIRINECITVASVNTFEVAGNIVKDRIFPSTEPIARGGEGIDAKNACTNGKIYNNTVSNLDKLGIYLDAFAETMDGVDVYNNRVFNCAAGIVTVVEGEVEFGSPKAGILRNVRVYNNVIWDIRNGVGIRVAGYLADGPQQNIRIYQNTVVRCLGGLLLEADDPNTRDIFIKNNIFAYNTRVQMKKTGAITYTVQNNLIAGTNPAAEGGVTGSNATVIASAANNPVRFANPANPGAPTNGFRLLSTSPAVNKVQDVAFRASTDILGTSRTIFGAADYGAYEYRP